MSKLLLILWVLITVATCGDCSKQKCTDHYFSGETRSYVFRTSGSKWIYKDTVHQLHDTLTLVRTSLSYSENCDEIQPGEVLDQVWKSSYFFGDSSFRVSAIASLSSSIYSELPPLIMAYVDSNIRDFQTLGITSMDSALVMGKWYHGIKVISYIYGEQPPLEFWWSVDAGLIRRKVHAYSDTTIYQFDLMNYFPK